MSNSENHVHEVTYAMIHDAMVTLSNVWTAKAHVKIYGWVPSSYRGSDMETLTTSRSTWHLINLKRPNSLLQRLRNASCNLVLQQNWTTKYAWNRLLATSQLDLVAKWRVCFREPIWTENFHKFWCFATAMATSSRINLNSTLKVALLSFRCPRNFANEAPIKVLSTYLPARR